MSSFLEDFQQVETFTQDEDNEFEDEEVFYVTLDLGQLHPSLLPNVDSYRLIGLDTRQPFLQLGGSIFRGQHEDLLGTELIMQEPSGNSSNLVPLTLTERRITFKEVQLIPKHEADREMETNIPITTASSVTNRNFTQDESTPIFLPLSKKGEAADILPPPKGKRRWRKRPDGYHTGDEEQEVDALMKETTNQDQDSQSESTSNESQ